MMELQPLKIRFYPKLKSGTTNSYCLYMRMTLSGKRTDLSTNYQLKRESWNDVEQTLNIKHPDRGYIINLTNQYRHRALEIYQKNIQRDLTSDVNEIKQKITSGTNSNEDSYPTLLKLFDRAIERKNKMSGKNNSKASIQKYKRCKSHLAQFMITIKKKNDIKCNSIDLMFIEDFELYLKTSGKCCHNSTMKYIQTFKTVFKSAIAYGWTDKDPFQKFKVRMEEVVRDFWTEKELQKLIQLKIASNALEIVRDLFVFCCFTGLAYIDLKNLSVKNIHNENGKYWIRIRRQKTNVNSNIPLLQLPLELIKKYLPEFESEDSEIKMFNVISNQKINEHLKNLAALCGVKKCLTFHIARHTFATTVTLNNDVPIESVSSMLGHKHIATTQHYAKLLCKKLGNDMDILSGKLNY